MAVTNIKIHSIGAHSLNITWDSLLPYQSFPEITGYKIRYLLLTDQGESSRNNVLITVNSSNASYRVTGLQRNTSYCVTVFAYNEHGDGEINNCTAVTTASGDVMYLDIITEGL